MLYSNGYYWSTSATRFVLNIEIVQCPRDRCVPRIYLTSLWKYQEVNFERLTSLILQDGLASARLGHMYTNN